MNKKNKRWSALTTKDLAGATKQFDDPEYDPPARPAPKGEADRLRRVRSKSKKSRRDVAVALESDLINRIDEYAATHGITFSEVVSDALHRLIQKKSA